MGGLNKMKATIIVSERRFVMGRLFGGVCVCVAGVCLSSLSLVPTRLHSTPHLSDRCPLIYNRYLFALSVCFNHPIT